MKYVELKDSIASGASPVYLLEGEDAYFRLKGEEQIKSAFLEMPELNFSAFEGETLKGAEILNLVNALKNYPFMAEKRVVKVTEFYPTEQEFERYLKPLFDDFPQSGLLIIVNSGSKRGADLRRKKPVAYVDCGKADRETVARWIFITLKRAKIYCPSDVCESLADYCLSNMARVSVEVQKLIDYKQSGELTIEEIDELVYKDADYRVYEMTKALAAKNYTAYCAISTDLKSKGYDEISILNSLFSYFRNLLSADTSPLSDAAYAKETGAKEFAVKKTREQARAFGRERIESFINLTYKCIADVKSGAVTPQSALRICENTIFFDGK